MSSRSCKYSLAFLAGLRPFVIKAQADFCSCTYHFAIVELFRPFTMTSTNPTPHAAPLVKAKLPVEPCLSVAINSALQARTVQNRVAKLYSRDQFMNFFPYYALPVAFETLPSISSLSPTFSYHAASAFLDALRVLFHASSQLPVIQYAAMGIEQAASGMNIILPDEAKAMFESFKRRNAEDDDRNRGKSTGSLCSPLLTQMSKRQDWTILSEN